MKDFPNFIQKILNNHEKHKKYFAFLIVLSLLIGITVPMVLTEPAESMTYDMSQLAALSEIQTYTAPQDAKDGGSYVTSVTVTQKPGEQGKYSVGFSYSFEQNYINSDERSAYFALSTNVLTDSDLSGPIIGSDSDSVSSFRGQRIGEWRTETIDGITYVVVTFDEEYVNAHYKDSTGMVDAITGRVTFDATVNRSDTEGGSDTVKVGDREFEFGVDYGFTVHKEQKGYSASEGKLFYSVTITANENGSGKGDTTITIVDTFDNSELASFNSNSITLNGQLIDPSNIKVENGVITITVPALGSNDVYVLEYEADINKDKVPEDADFVQVGNSVKVTSPTVEESDRVDSTLYVDYTVVKNGNNNNDGTITWTIEVHNPDGDDLTGFTLEDDQLSNAFDITYDPSGVGTHEDGSGKITFNSTHENKITITYRTKAPLSGTVDNEAVLKDDGGEPKDKDKASVSINSNCQISKSGSPNYNDGTIEWTVEISGGWSDQNKYDWSGLVLKDLLEKNNLPSDTSVSIQYWEEYRIDDWNTGYRWSETSYPVNVSDDGKITIPELPELSRKILLTYTTKVEGDLLYTGGNVTNDISFDDDPNIKSQGTAYYDPGYSIFKSGSVESVNGSDGYYVWTVTVHTNGASLKGFEISDTITRNGVESNPFNSNDVTVTAKTQSGAAFTDFEFKNGKIVINEDVYEDIIFTYKTPADLDAFATGSETVSNGAGLTGPGGFSKNTDPVKPDKPFGLDKHGDYNGIDNEVDWSIVVRNSIGRNLEGYYVEDTMLSYVDDEGITVTGDNGRTLSEGTDYIFDDTNGKITFKSITDSVITITYSTDASQVPKTGNDIINDATLKDPSNNPLDNGRASVTHEERNDITKSAESGSKNQKISGVNSATPELKWKVSLGRVRGGLKNQTYKDTLSATKTGTHYITKEQAEALTIVNHDDPGQTLTRGTDYTITWKAGSTTYNSVADIPEDAKLTGFEIKFTKNTTLDDISDVDILYSSTADVSSVNNNESVEFTNEGDMNGSKDSAKYNWTKKQAYVKYDANNWDLFHKWVHDTADTTGGTLSEHFDFSEPTHYSTSELKQDETYYYLSYHIAVNENQAYDGSTDVTLYDTLPEGFELVEAKFTKSSQMDQYYDSECTATSGKQDDRTAVEFKIPSSYHNGNAFYIDYEIKIEKSKLEKMLDDAGGDVPKITLTNTITDGGFYGEETQDVTVEKAVISKDGSQTPDEKNNNYVSYDLDFNPDELDLSSGDTVKLVDTIYSDDHIIGNQLVSWWDKGAFKTTLVHIEIIDLTDPDHPVEITDYKMTFDNNPPGQGNEGGQRAAYSAKLTLEVPDGKHLHIKYRYHIARNYSDDYYISGIAIFNKVRVESELVTEEASSDNVYYLEESSDASAEAGSTQISIVKVDKDRFQVELQGAVFNLYKYVDGKWLPLTGMTETDGQLATAQWGTNENDTPHDFVTNEAGRAALPKLDEQVAYKMVEVTPPSGYIKNTEPYYFFYKSRASSLPSGLSADMFDTLYKNSPGYITNEQMKNGSVQGEKEWVDDTGEKTDPPAGSTVRLQLYKSTSPPPGRIDYEMNLVFGNNTVQMSNEERASLANAKITKITIDADTTLFTEDYSTTVEIAGKQFDISSGKASESYDPAIALPDPLTVNSESASAISKIIIELEGGKRITIINGKQTQVGEPAGAEVNVALNDAHHTAFSSDYQGKKVEKAEFVFSTQPSWLGVWLDFGENDSGWNTNYTLDTSNGTYTCVFIYENLQANNNINYADYTKITGIGGSGDNYNTTLQKIVVTFDDGSTYTINNTNFVGSRSLISNLKTNDVRHNNAIISQTEVYNGYHAYMATSDILPLSLININGMEIDAEPWGEPITLDGTPDDKGEIKAWLAQWDDLPIMDELGNKFYYYVQEVNSESFNGTEYSDNGIFAAEEGSAPAVVVISNNTGTPSATKKVQVNKIWKDGNNDEGLRPDSISITLYQSIYSDLTLEELGDETKAKVHDNGKTLNAENGWSVSWDELPRFVDINAEPRVPYYYYVVEELNDAHKELYTVTYSGNGSNTINITNTRTGDIDVDKRWLNDSNVDVTDKTTHDPVKFQLYRMASKGNGNSSERDKSKLDNIVALGDSITYGGYNTYDLFAWYPKTLQSLFKPANGYSSVKVIPQGVSGEQIPSFESRLGDITADTDIVCILGGTNDIHQNGGNPNSVILDRMEHLINKIWTEKNANVKIFVGSIPHFDFVYNGTYTTGATWWAQHAGYPGTEATIEQWQKFENTCNAKIDAYNALLKQYAQNTDNVYYAEVCDVVDKDTMLFVPNDRADGCHPNQEGYEKIAQAFYDAIESYYTNVEAPQGIDSKRPSGAQKYGEAFEISSGSEWSKTIHDLPLYDDDGNPYVYYIEEVTEMFDYDDTYKNNGVVPGSSSSKPTMEVDNTPKTDIDVKVTKIWRDSKCNDESTNDPKKGRPDITLVLMRSTDPDSDNWEELTDIPTPVPTYNGDEWEYIYEDLPARDSGGNRYYYKVVESSVPDGYKVEYGTESGVLPGASKEVELTVTNIKTISVEVEKKWSDGLEHLNDTITVKIHRSTEAPTDKSKIALTVSPEEEYLSFDETLTLTANKEGVTYTAEPEGIVEIKDGVVHVIGNQEADVTITAHYGNQTFEVKLHVTDKLSVTPKEITIVAGKTGKLTANKAVTNVTSNNSNIASATYSGKEIAVTAGNQAGDATLTVSASNNESCTVIVHVVAGLSITNNSSDLILIEGDSVTLTNSRNNKTLSYSYSPDLLSVSGNTITAGDVERETTVTVTATDEEIGDSVQFTITIQPFRITTDRDKAIIIVNNNGGKLQLTANKSSDVTWSVVEGDEGISVDPNTGLVSADSTVKDGAKATIQAKHKMGTDTIVVTAVEENEDGSLTVTPTEIIIHPGETIELKANKAITKVKNNQWSDLGSNDTISAEISGKIVSVTASSVYNQYANNEYNLWLWADDENEHVEVRIKVVPGLEIDDNYKNISIRVGNTKTITVTQGTIENYNIDDTGLVSAVVSDDKKSITITGISKGNTTLVLSDGYNEITINIEVKLPRESNVVDYPEIKSAKNYAEFDLSDYDPDEIVAIRVTFEGQITTNGTTVSPNGYINFDNVETKGLSDVVSEVSAGSGVYSGIYITGGNVISKVSIGFYYVDPGMVNPTIKLTIYYADPATLSLTNSDQIIPFASISGIAPIAGTSVQSDSLVFGDDDTATFELKCNNEGSSENWKMIINNLPACDDKGNTYYYWIEEISVNGNPIGNAFEAFYQYFDGDGTTQSDDTAIDGNSTGDNPKAVIINYKIESSGVEMPSTGGSGTRKYYVIGAIIMLIGAGYAMSERRKGRERAP